MAMCECDSEHCPCADGTDSAPATATDDGGNRVCAACAEYVTTDSGECICSRAHDGSTCPRCEQAIRWHEIQTHAPGVANDMTGECACGEWYRSDRGGWTVPSYTPRESA